MHIIAMREFRTKEKDKPSHSYQLFAIPQNRVHTGDKPYKCKWNIIVSISFVFFSFFLFLAQSGTIHGPKEIFLCKFYYHRFAFHRFLLPESFFAEIGFGSTHSADSLGGSGQGRTGRLHRVHRRLARSAAQLSLASTTAATATTAVT